MLSLIRNPQYLTDGFNYQTTSTYMYIFSPVRNPQYLPVGVNRQSAFQCAYFLQEETH